MARLSVELKRYFFEEEREAKVKLADILLLAEERIFGFLFVILSLPSALPIPAPGYSIPFGVLMFLLAIQLLGGAKQPWLPAKMMNGSMKLESVQGVVKGGMPWLERIEAITRPRMSYICTSLSGRIVIGVAIALMSVFMMIPIPGTNTLPAMGIFITAFGMQEDDGLISLGGLVVCLIATVVVLGILVGGFNVLHLLKDYIFS
ncbi:MAG: exopolysaccharide biosynthesis protein [Gomphosphaeria aponina SAG 52.96 = DSM 107014]|uniref:Exopolysaccharide biosynthesis protein n=1 Tax=Gomphosphaeria aponina SAG 52.96 = DSM 107014 TaxID=1521640 RepID=A0A941GNN0_9CHRO|nr:exopolysaccharide biosynthesis protein [Gomphosphaeria aponina SAG 52.96 = DSM 107014]